MIPDINIWRCANELIKQHGDLADIKAAAQADDFEAKGDRDGQRVWLIYRKSHHREKPEPILCWGLLIARNS